MNYVLVAILGPIAVAIGAVVQIHFTGKQRRQEKAEEAALRRQEKLEDWARQDAVAERLSNRQDAIAAQTQETAELLLQNNKDVAITARAANTKLDVIHTLVNSNMTAALQGELDSARANLATLRELIGLRVAQGQEPDEDTRVALKALEDKVGRLAANLHDRIEQTKVADAQIFVAKEEKIHDE